LQLAEVYKTCLDFLPLQATLEPCPTSEMKMPDDQSVETLNIKADMPSVEEARRRLIAAINGAKARGVGVLKIIHGYGASGVGGTLRGALRRSLSLRRKEGLIEDVIYGERWSVFDERALALIDRFPALRRDQDLNMSNEGVTVVVLKK